MAEWLSPRRIVSSSTTVTIAGTSSALRDAANSMASGDWLVFTGLNYNNRVPHPNESDQPASFFDCDVWEDGANFTGHPMVDWAGKGCYDTTSRRVMWAGTGANPGTQPVTSTQGYSYKYNTQPIYNETSATGTANTWTVNRAFRGQGESTSAEAIIHCYDNNCINVPGRRFYKKKFRSAEIMVFSLDTNTWLTNIPGPPTEAGYARNQGMEYVPTRGSQGSLWLYSLTGSEVMRIFEYDIASASGWTNPTLTGAALPNWVSAANASSTISYNPRAFSNAGGVLCGMYNNPVVINCATMVVSAVATPPVPINTPHNIHICRDPTGSGWLFFPNNGRVYYCDGSTWTDRGPIQPSDISASDTNRMTVPIDAEGSNYGVIWILAATNGGTKYGYLYKP